MSNLDINHHTHKQFNAELKDLHNQVLAMGGLVEQQLADALAALTDGDRKRGDTVNNNDYKVNAMDVAIDEECAQILALRQPAASDLRFIVSVIKTTTDMERIGDEAAKIARMAVQLADQERPKNNYAEIEHLGQKVQQMVRDTLNAFARTDAEAALEIAQKDVKVDREYEAVLRQLITHMMEDPRSIRRVLDVIWAARALERIGDHAKNICEYIIYLVKGKDVRHIHPDEIAKKLSKEN